MSSNSQRRSSSEYSVNSDSYNSHSSDKIVVDDSEKKVARGLIYRVLFSHWMAKVAILPSLISGAIPIFIYLVYGRIINELTIYYSDIRTLTGEAAVKAGDEVLSRISVFSSYMAIISIGSLICKFLDTFFWIRLGSFLSTKMKHDLFENMMHSEVTFFDVNPIGNILTLLSEDAQSVQDAFGTTKGTQIGSIGQFFTGIILAYIYSWRLALVATATIPCLFIVLLAVMPPIIHAATERFKCVAESMTIAEETLASIRTVRGFNRESVEVKRFMNQTKLSGDFERTIGIYITILIVCIQVIIWGATIGNFYWGSTLVDKGVMFVGDLFSVFGFTMFGCFGLVQLQSSMQSEQKAVSSGARIMKLSQHVPEIPFEGGDIIEDFKGNIEFRNVSFKYPTRDVYVLKNVSFEIKAGQIGALVGHSGSGKSTCVQLLERFYDATEGLVLLDGHDIKTLDPRWLHRKMALVSQEPTLFKTSIKINIKYGAPDATDQEVIDAAEVANAKKFVEKLDNKYDQQVGERGSSLSGGQRQRIAIARGVIKNPVILITDEATSALDSQSEKKVQYALDKVMLNRTAVIVAHRLSTIRNAHVIYVFDAGEIKEVGTHDSLLTLGGFYYSLVQRQLTQEDDIKKKNADILKKDKKKKDKKEKKEKKEKKSKKSAKKPKSDVSSDSSEHHYSTPSDTLSDVND